MMLANFMDRSQNGQLPFILRDIGTANVADAIAQTLHRALDGQKVERDVSPANC